MVFKCSFMPGVCTQSFNIFHILLFGSQTAQRSPRTNMEPPVQNCSSTSSSQLRNIMSSVLVGGLDHFLFSHILGIIIPIDFHIFQRGGPTTNQCLFGSFRKRHLSQPLLWWHMVQVTPAACRYSPAVDIYALGLVRTGLYLSGILRMRPNSNRSPNLRFI